MLLEGCEHCRRTYNLPCTYGVVHGWIGYSYRSITTIITTNPNYYKNLSIKLTRGVKYVTKRNNRRTATKIYHLCGS